MSAREFALQIDREFDEALEDLRAKVIKAATRAVTSIVKRTPVDSGLARGNWTVTLGGEDFSTSHNLDPSGGATIAAGVSKIESLPEIEWPVIYIQNNLPYINRLENGWSGQAPNGMVAVTLAQLMAEF
jgi:hypothetical protein